MNLGQYTRALTSALAGRYPAPRPSISFPPMEPTTLHTPTAEGALRIALEKSIFPGPVGNLEAVTALPAREPAAVAIVCHPHPLHGGTLDNKVTHALARAFTDLGAAAVRFNFRGVGRSCGAFAHGEGEREDLLAVVAGVRERFPDREIWLAGFSFGGYVAASAADAAGAAWLVTVAPAVNLFDGAAVAQPHCPWLLVQGTADEVVPYATVRRWAAQRYPAPDAVYLDGVGHYFHGRLNDLRRTVTAHAPFNAVPAQVGHG